MRFTILVVDDEKNIREGLGKAMQLDGHEVVLARDGVEAKESLVEADIDLVLTDLRMPNLSGEQLLKHVASAYPTIKVIILTGHGTIETAVQAMHDGAYDFLTKPVDLDRLSLLVKRALAERELVLRNRSLTDELERKSLAKVIGNSEPMKGVFEVVNQVAPTRASVLITGESGVGKEVVADAIHQLSPRRDKPVIKVHCAALTESLLESELFGHERGSFTGATGRRRGRFELAHLGTIFLDEIGEISQNIQIKLLRVLQNKAFERVGGEETVEVDVRIISATNKDLKEETEAGRFREDLYYRLNVISINVPPLRERTQDIPLLIAAFLKEFAAENGKDIDGIDPKAQQLLVRYPWPGNVRELRNCLESAVVMVRSAVITAEDLPPYIGTESTEPYVRLSLGASLADGEREMIRLTLAHYNGNKSRTAEVLGIGRKTLHRKLSEYAIS